LLQAQAFALPERNDDGNGDQKHLKKRKTVKAPKIFLPFVCVHEFKLKDLDGKIQSLYFVTDIRIYVAPKWN
jgi:hypothetical protein